MCSSWYSNWVNVNTFDVKLSLIIVVFDVNGDVYLVCKRMMPCRTYPLVSWHEVYMCVILSYCCGSGFHILPVCTGC